MEGSVKIIFLDIDGVMNRRETAPRNRFVGFDPVPVNCLNEILAATGASIVVTGALGRSMYLDDLKLFFQHSGISGDLIVGVTAFLGGTRGEDISAWLEEHPDHRKCYIVIDDAGPEDIRPHCSRFIKTNWETGLTPACIPHAVRLLNRKRHL